MDKNMAKDIAMEVVKLGHSKLLTSTGVALLCGYEADSTGVRQILQDPTFPSPVQLVEGGRKRWVRTEVEAWLDARILKYRSAANDPVFAREILRM